MPTITARIRRKIIWRAMDAAWEAGEDLRIANGRIRWTEEEIDAAAIELKRRLLDGIENEE